MKKKLNNNRKIKVEKVILQINVKNTGNKTIEKCKTFSLKEEKSNCKKKCF